MIDLILPILAVLTVLGLLDVASLRGGAESRDGFLDPRVPDHWASVG